MRIGPAISILGLLIAACVIAACVIAPCLVVTAAAQAAPASVSLQEQLDAQYKFAKMSPNFAGDRVVLVTPGTLLAMQKGGVLGVPFRSRTVCPSKFQDNSLHASTGFCAGMMKSVSQYFQIGNKVYPLKIEVSLDKGKISFQVVSCDSCNGIDPPTGLKAEVVFEFAKGYLEKAGAGAVEDTIGQVFAISAISNDEPQAQGNAGAGQQQAADQQPAQPEQQAEPQTIQLGQTTDEVQAVMGKPEKIVNLGPKQIYVYKDLKITFMNGKVSDVQ
jgi:hypothetical protein